MTVLAATSRTGTGLAVEGLGVEVRSREGWRPLVQGVSFTAAPGSILGLVGESGSGKSVTGLAIMGLLPRGRMRVTGSARLGDLELVGLPAGRLSGIRGDRVSMVFQEPMSSLNPALTIGRQITDIVRRHRALTPKQARTLAADMLGRVGIPRPEERLDSYPHEFSGGMRQRVVIAMALVCEPEVVIADEPTTALDVTIQAQVLVLLRRLTEEMRVATLLVTHDMGVVAETCERVAVMYAGQIVENGTTADVFARPRHAYTEGLLLSIPEMSESVGGLHSIGGTPPSPWEWSDGCRFAPRCRHARPKCEAPPPLADDGMGTGHLSRCVRMDEVVFRGVLS